MDWFNWIGLIIVVIIMFPNIIYAIKKKEDFSNDIGKTILLFEQIGRYGCMAFMIFNIPYTYFNFWFGNALITYVVINAILVLIYVILFFATWNAKNLFKVLSLSILPSLIFIFSGITLLNIPLMVFGITFAVCHITVSVKNYERKSN